MRAQNTADDAATAAARAQTTAEAGANVQADYAETDQTSDSFIRNKPDINPFTAEDRGEAGRNTGWS